MPQRATYRPLVVVFTGQGLFCPAHPRRMGFFHSVQAVASATGDGPIDWSAVADAAKGATDTGDLTVETPERDGYATDVRDARHRVREVGELPLIFPKPSKSRTGITGSTPTSPRSAA